MKVKCQNSICVSECFSVFIHYCFNSSILQVFFMVNLTYRTKDMYAWKQIHIQPYFLFHISALWSLNIMNRAVSIPACYCPHVKEQASTPQFNFIQHFQYKSVLSFCPKYCICFGQQCFPHLKECPAFTTSWRRVGFHYNNFSNSQALLWIFYIIFLLHLASSTKCENQMCDLHNSKVVIFRCHHLIIS